VRVVVTVEQCWHRVPGGTAVAALELIRHLSGEPDLDLVGVAAAHRSDPAPPWRPPLTVVQHRLPRPVLYEAWAALGRPRVEGRAGAADVVHATTVVPAGTRLPLVVTVHDLAFLHHPEHHSRRAGALLRRSWRAVCERAALVLCSSEATRADAVERGLDAARARVVPLGVDPTVATEDEVTAARDEFGLRRPYVFWNGSIEPRKNLPALVAAFDEVATELDVDLVLAGPQGWRESLPDRIGSVADRHRERIRAVGFVPAGTLRALHAGAAAFCYPSLMEGFGFPVLEALAQGTPVITSRGTSTEELVGGAGLLVDPADPGELADALRRVLTDQALAASLRAAAPARAAEFGWERTASATVAAYREVAR
jgi:glycosyltransferase involved in cell wall biosynthesis